MVGQGRGAEGFFSPGLKSVIAYDTTPFIRLSIEEVKTLIEAFSCVPGDAYLPQNQATLTRRSRSQSCCSARSAVMPVRLINVPPCWRRVAIGLLVDDAIAVVENVERLMSEEGLSPKEATRKSMGQITGALVGIALVLAAVFIPMAFFGGSTGVIYRQFSITMASSMALSVVVALILSPALCATLLTPLEKGSHGATRGFFGWFNRSFERGSSLYQRIVGRMLHSTGRWLAAYAVMIALGAFLLLRLPTSFSPDEDQESSLPRSFFRPGPQERTLAVLREASGTFCRTKRRRCRRCSRSPASRFPAAARMPASPSCAQGLEGAAGARNTVQAVSGRAMAAFSKLRDAMVFAFAPPAVLELGVANGFDLYLQDRTGAGHEALIAARNQLLGIAAKDPVLVAVRPNGQEDTPQFSVDVDTVQAGALGLSMADVNATLAAAWGSAYVNDFIDKGRVKKVYLRLMRRTAWFRRTSTNGMCATRRATWCRFRCSRAPLELRLAALERFNGSPAVEIQGQAAPAQFRRSDGSDGTTGGAAAARIGIAWTGLSYEERLAGAGATALAAVDLVVFLCLAALYESWSIPFAVLLIVPLGVLGALLAVAGRGLSDDVYFQVGLLTTIGLSAKNAILIIQFAQAQIAAGVDVVPATLEAVRLRLRPILMTSLAFGGGHRSRSPAGLGLQPNAIGNVFGRMVNDVPRPAVRATLLRRREAVRGRRPNRRGGRSTGLDSRPSGSRTCQPSSASVRVGQCDRRTRVFAAHAKIAAKSEFQRATYIWQQQMGSCACWQAGTG
jgi:multidrug efflux pump